MEMLGMDSYMMALRLGHREYLNANFNELYVDDDEWEEYEEDLEIQRGMNHRGFETRLALEEAERLFVASTATAVGGHAFPCMTESVQNVHACSVMSSDQIGRMNSSSGNTTTESDKVDGKKKRRTPLYKLNPEDFKDDPVQQNRILKAKRCENFRLASKKNVASLTAQNQSLTAEKLELAVENAKLKKELEQYKKLCPELRCSSCMATMMAKLCHVSSCPIADS